MFKSLFIAAILVAIVVQADARKGLLESDNSRSLQRDIAAKNVLSKGLFEAEKLVAQVIDDDLKIPFLNEVLTIVHKTIRKVRSFHESLPSFIKDILDKGVDYSTNFVLRLFNKVLNVIRYFINKFKDILFF